MNGEHVSIRVLPDGKGAKLTDGNSRGNVMKSDHMLGLSSSPWSFEGLATYCLYTFEWPCLALVLEMGLITCDV